MPRRQRWTPLKGTQNRVYDPAERLLLGALDMPGRAAAAIGRALGARRTTPLPAREAIREVLVLRLDRIGDVLMCLPALADLRAALPRARIRLAVGSWSAELARGFPVDEVLVWSPPWAGRKDEGTEALVALLAKARALREDTIDLGIDLQGDVRAMQLLWLTGARVRVGYANTGGAYLLTHVVPLDETVSWVEQNRRAVAAALGDVVRTPRPHPLTPEDRAFAEGLLKSESLETRRPLVGLHPSGGRRIKQWDLARWAEVAARLQRSFGATLLVTGSPSDRPLATALVGGLPEPPLDLTGRLTVRQTLALIARLDLFLSPDTGPMHMAAAVGTPSVSVFGPSDPVRYFSGREEDGGAGARHAIVRAPLWCSPCNLIRKPPAECSRPEGPECLRLVGADAVYQEAARLLRAGGHAGR
jgi:lipopolysaccharide heptosyltransferase II